MEKPNDEAFRIIARIRPLLNASGDMHTTSTLQAESDGKHLTLTPSCYRNRKVCPSYKFNKVLAMNSTQIEAFEEIKCQVEGFLNGYNATVLTYGQTGTGKTYTMLGPDAFLNHPHSTNNPGNQNIFSPDNVMITDSHGLIPRTLNYIFKNREYSSSNNNQGANNPDEMYSSTIKCSYMEIYNEGVYDLLSSASTVKSRRDLGVRDGPDGGVIVPGLTSVTVKTLSDVYVLLSKGADNRAMKATAMNDQSSRSHTIFQVTRGSSKLQLVDLAGSEKYHSSYRHNSIESKEQHFKELAYINKSLTALGHCVASLLQATRSHVPYRSSKLTRVLEDSLGGNALTSIFITLGPEEVSFQETLSTIKFANRAKKLTSRPRKAVSAIVQNVHEYSTNGTSAEVREINELLDNFGGPVATTAVQKVKALLQELLEERQQKTKLLLALASLVSDHDTLEFSEQSAISKAIGILNEQHEENEVQEQSTMEDESLSDHLNDEDCWEEAVDSVSGCKYYHNVNTGKTQWERPPTLT